MPDYEGLSPEEIKQQQKILNDFLELVDTPEELEKKDKISRNWSGSFLAVVRRRHVIKALQKFLNQEISTKYFYNWCNEILINECIGYEIGYSFYITEITTGYVQEFDMTKKPITPEEAQQWIKDLETAQFDPEDEPIDGEDEIDWEVYRRE